MVFHALAGDIPSISKALNSFDLACLSTTTVVHSIQEALQSLRNAVLPEIFVNASSILNSQQ
jgi:hypothetical protein